MAVCPMRLRPFVRNNLSATMLSIVGFIKSNSNRHDVPLRISVLYSGLLLRVFGAKIVHSGQSDLHWDAKIQCPATTI